VRVGGVIATFQWSQEKGASPAHTTNAQEKHKTRFASRESLGRTEAKETRDAIDSSCPSRSLRVRRSSQPRLRE
jgi:hypothetical protein